MEVKFMEKKEKKKYTSKDVNDIFRNAKRPDRTQLKKEAQEFYESLLAKERASSQLAK